ncbi:peptidoglycan-binding protein [Halalkalibaculum sp. DA384]|uniref:peptidoglycan-binding protein n=1 Tax=Halalkalibaculum sp. DA384 TaxID=3373606 RepID=UPI0037545083
MEYLTQHSTDINLLSDTRRMLRLTIPHMQGEDVKTVQRKLALKPCGKYGPDTRAAVMEFQAREGLAVDGIVGPNTWAALDEISTVPAQPKSSVIGRIKALPAVAMDWWRRLSPTEKLMYGAGGAALLVGIGFTLHKKNGR